MTDLTALQRQLAAGEIGQVLRELEALLVHAPQNVDALYLQAVAYRYAQQTQSALGSLQQLKRLSPSHARAYQEEGHLYRDQGAIDQALQAYRQAYTLNPALEASLRESIRLLSDSGRVHQAQPLIQQLRGLQQLPAPLRSVLELMAQHKLLKAETVCRAFLREHPDHVEGMRLLADIAVQLGVLDDAEFLLESATAFAPDNLRVRIDYVQILRKRQKFADALAQSQQLLGEHPNNLQIKSICAIEHMQTGDYVTAMQLLDEVLQRVPQDAATLVTYGHAQKTAGQTQPAIERYRQAMSYQPLHGEAYYSLANLKTYRFEPSEFEQLQAVEQNPALNGMDRVYVHFALAKAYEDQGDHAKAFAQYALGNAQKKAQSRYDADRMQEEMQALQALCDADFFTQRSHFGDPAADPIFIVGLPRAGSTLLEQILSSHSQVDGTAELPNILSLSQRLRRRRQGGGYPSVLGTLSAEECAEFGQTFLRETQIHRAGAALFIDKMPNNFRHIGLIKLILPNAKIIDARREPMACCFSGFKQLFAEGQEFSYDLNDIGRYYRDYVGLMDHWDRALPGYVLRVQHEDVVDDLEAQVRRILVFCHLPFEPACLRFYETQRNVRTPSSEQVRQPIFREGLAQWRHFEPWLDPLAQALAAQPPVDMEQHGQ